MTSVAQNWNSVLWSPRPSGYGKLVCTNSACTRDWPMHEGGVSCTKVFRFLRPASVSRIKDAAGWRAPTPWSVTRTSYSVPHVAHMQWSPWYGGACNGLPASYQQEEACALRNDIPSFPVLDRSDLVNSNVIKLLGKIKDDESINLSVAFFERKSTENLLISAMDRIGDTIRTFRRLKRGDWKRVLDLDRKKKAIRASGRGLTRREEILMRAPESWLEVQYGWVPVMNDVYGACHAVDKAQSLNAYRFCQSARTRERSVRAFSVGNSEFGNFRWGGKLNQIYDVLHRVDYTVQTDALNRIAELGLANPLSVIWELVPFSFVYDWFQDISGWFNTFDATLGKSFKGGTLTEVLRIEDQSLKPTFYPPVYGTVGYSPSDAVGSVSHFMMRRDVLSSFPSATLPAFKNPCSPSHVASALSLLAVAFGRGRVAPYVGR